MSLVINQSLSAVGVTAVAAVLASDFVVLGTFVGSWKCEILLNDTWVPIESGTAPGAYLNVRFAVLRQIRFTVDAYTSGTLVFSLNGRDYGA